MITRNDISPGYQVVQSTHSIADFANDFKDVFNRWKQESNSIICLQAKSKSHLLELYEKFKTLTEVSIFFEPDVNEYTSLCLHGTPDIRKKLSSLPLILRQKKELV